MTASYPVFKRRLYRICRTAMSTMALGSLNPHPSQIWWVFLLKGLAGIILGFMLLTEPAATLVALTTLLGFYWLVLGVLSLVQVLWIARFLGSGHSSPAS